MLEVQHQTREAARVSDHIRDQPIVAARFNVDRSKAENPADERLVDVDSDDLANLDLGYVAREDAPSPDDLLAVHAQDRRRPDGQRPEQG